MNARDLGLDIAERNLRVLNLMEGKVKVMSDDADKFASSAKQIRINAVLKNGQWTPVEKDIKAAEETFKKTQNVEDYKKYTDNLEIGFIYLLSKINKKLQARLDKLKTANTETLPLLAIEQIFSEAERGRISITAESKAQYEKDFSHLSDIEKLEQILESSNLKTKINELLPEDKKKYLPRETFMVLRTMELEAISKHLKVAEEKQVEAVKEVTVNRRAALKRRRAKVDKVRMGVYATETNTVAAASAPFSPAFTAHTPKSVKSSNSCFGFFFCCPSKEEEAAEDLTYRLLSGPR